MPHLPPEPGPILPIAMGDYTDIQVEIEDPVALIRLNRPKTLNAFTGHTLAEIRRAVDAASRDARVVGIVITGNGRGFSSGLDSQTLVRTTAGEGSEPPDPSPDELPGIFSYFLRVPKPIVAAVNGVAAGGGLIMAMMSDVRIASRDASFLTIFLKRGLIAEHGSSWLLPRMVGVGRALDLLLTSDRIDAETAHRIGLVEHLCEPDVLVDTARAYVQRIAENAAPAAIAETKRLIYGHLGTDYVAALREADVSQRVFVTAPDAKEGAEALIQKRPPRFSRLEER